MAFNRDQINNSLKPVSDEKLSSEQTRKRVEKHNKPAVNDEPELIAVGDYVYLKDDKTKVRGREKYKIVKMFSKLDEKWAILQKSNTKFMAKEYEAKITEIFPVLKKKVSPEKSASAECETNSNDVNSDSETKNEGEPNTNEIQDTSDDNLNVDEKTPTGKTLVTKDPVRKLSRRKLH